MKARAAFQNLEGVTRVLAYGHNGKVLLYCSDKKAVNRQIADERLADVGLRLRRIRRR